MIEVRVRHHFAGGADSAPFTLDVQFKTAAGVAVLFGPSGAGKTRTLDAIAGFIRPDEGRILVDDTLLYDGAAGVSLAPRVRRCGYVFQNYALFPHMTLRENLEFAGHHLSRLERRRQVGELLEQFHLADVAGRRPHELSGGQKQRCSIARALLAAPRVLLLDEPARGLDAALRGEFYELLYAVRTRYRMPVLLVTHDLDECLELGDELFVMQAGRVVQAGEPFAVLDRPASVEVARLLGRANLLAAEVLALDPAQRTSRLRCVPEGGEPFEIRGPHLPGRLLGDRLTIAIRPEQVVARPRDAAGPGVTLPLERQAERSTSVALQFRGGIRAELPRAGYAQYGHNKEWVVEFPPEALRIF